MTRKKVWFGPQKTQRMIAYTRIPNTPAEVTDKIVVLPETMRLARGVQGWFSISSQSMESVRVYFHLSRAYDHGTSDTLSFPNLEPQSMHTESIPQTVGVSLAMLNVISSLNAIGTVLTTHYRNLVHVRLSRQYESIAAVVSIGNIYRGERSMSVENPETWIVPALDVVTARQQ